MLITGILLFLIIPVSIHFIAKYLLGVFGRSKIAYVLGWIIIACFLAIIFYWSVINPQSFYNFAGGHTTSFEGRAL